jgi:hypothetical protein
MLGIRGTGDHVRMVVSLAIGGCSGLGVALWDGVRVVTGPVTQLGRAVEASIQGSWWSHPADHDIYAGIMAVRASSEVLTTRLVNPKITLVHRGLWPALVCVADDLSGGQLAALQEDHVFPLLRVRAVARRSGRSLTVLKWSRLRKP